jgi:2-oxoglutarate dehydrogenase E2 component (dihydrolipoamide succinyltransferase)
MAYEIKVPTVGESISEVTVANWVKKEGELVAQDDIICELETDKTTFEVPAERSGILHIVAEAGATIPIGAVLCTISENGAAAVSATPSATVAPQKEVAAASATGEKYAMKVPVVGESISEVTVSSWIKKNGDFVQMDESICEIETEKATFELKAERSGFLTILHEEGATLAVGDVICEIAVADAPAGGASSAVQAPAQATTSAPSSTASHAAGHPSPAAAKILAEKGIPAGDVNGTGVGGRITKDDALGAEKKVVAPVTSAEAVKAAVKAPEPAKVVVASGDRDDRREKMTTIRKTIAKRLVAAKNQTAMLTTFNEVDMSAVMELRKKYKDKFKDKHEVGLGFMSFFAKAACAALQEFPAVNAIIDGEDIVYHNYCDVSIAVSTPKGLVVPIIRNAEKLSLAGIEKEVVNLAIKARDGKLTIPEMTGGTFTITNGGIFGSMLSTPIINAPQSAILGLHNIVERPVVVNGQIVIRPIMYVALSYDHRIIDGRESVSFLYRIKEMIEDPARLLLGV